MKKMMTITLLLGGMILAAGLLLQPVNAYARNGNNPQEQKKDLPDTIQKIFEKACIGCHSSDGNAMARSKVNFSEWAKYDAAKQAAKAADICKMVTKAKMPPKGFRKNHPEDVPTKEDLDALCRWAASFNK